MALFKSMIVIAICILYPLFDQLRPFAMASQPQGYGMTAELQRQKDAKYDPELERQAVNWIEAVLGEKVFGGATGQDEIHKVLKDGVVLCRLANALGGNVKFNQSKMAFKMMENIGKFLEFCDKLGVPKSDMFQTVDLYEKQNMPAVINGILALRRKVLGQGSTPQSPPQTSSDNTTSHEGDHFGRPRQNVNVYT